MNERLQIFLNFKHLLHCITFRNLSYSNSTNFIQRFQREKFIINLDNLLVWRQSSSLLPSLSPCQSSRNHFQRLFQKAIEDLRLANQWPSLLTQWLGTALAGWTGKRKKQGDFELASVAAGCDRLALRRSAATFAKLTQFES